MPKYNQMPKQPTIGTMYNTKRDYVGNLLEYDTVEEDDNGEIITVHHEFRYNSANQKTRYFDSNGAFSVFMYKNGQMAYEANGSVRTGISTEHYYNDRGEETLKRRSDIESKEVRDTVNGVTRTYYTPFIRVYTNPLYR